jgi:hypothetical protein
LFVTQVIRSPTSVAAAILDFDVSIFLIANANSSNVSGVVSTLLSGTPFKTLIAVNTSGIVTVVVEITEKSTAVQMPPLELAAKTNPTLAFSLLAKFARLLPIFRQAL